MSEKKQRSETNVVINDKSQGSVATHLSVVKFSIVTILQS